MVGLVLVAYFYRRSPAGRYSSSGHYLSNQGWLLWCIGVVVSTTEYPLLVLTLKIMLAPADPATARVLIGENGCREEKMDADRRKWVPRGENWC